MMNTAFPSKTRRLAVKITSSMLILVALLCVATPLTAFACSEPEFATILKGFCQAFKADLENQQGLIDTDINDIISGNSVRQVLEDNYGLSDSDVLAFEQNEISAAKDDFINGTTYDPQGCGLGNRDTATDSNDFQIFFDSQQYTDLNSDTIDSIFTDAVRAADSSTVNSSNRAGSTNPRTDNIAEPKFILRRNTSAHPCTDQWTLNSFDPSTNTTFYTLKTGGAPAFCEKVIWNFANRTVGKDCDFLISPLRQTFTLTFINSSGQQVDSSATIPGYITLWHENDIKQIQLDFTGQSNATLLLGGIWYNNC